MLVGCILFSGNAFCQDLIIQNVNVIDVESGEMLNARDVEIELGLIKSITTTKNRKQDPNTNYIDGSGKYLVPGFIDSHVHVAMGPVSLKFEEGKPVLHLEPNEELTKVTCELLLEYGITTARDPGGRTDITVGTRNAIQNGEMVGPELVVAGSVIDTVDFRNLTTVTRGEREIREEVKRQKELGVDIVKLYTSLSPELLKAGIDEAHKQDILATAHLHSTSWSEAANLGIDNIVHIIPGNDDVIPDQFKENYNKAFGTQAFYKWFEYVDLESIEVKEMIQTLKRNNVSIDPTLVPFHAAFYGNTGEYQSNAALDRLPEVMINNWKGAFNFNLGWKDSDYIDAQKTWSKVQNFTKMLFDNGVLLTAGTDANNPWTVPGDSFHRELKLLNECGISTIDVLRIATINGATIINKEQVTGSIRKGKEADLVLLTENPLENIEATRSIELVINNGKIR